MSIQPIDAVDTIGHLDFTPDHACEVTLRKGGVCGEQAIWLTIHGCCGHSAEMCARHGAQFLAIVANAIANGTTVQCLTCQSRQQDPTLFRAVPLSAA